MKDIHSRFYEALQKDLLSHAYILEGSDPKRRRELAMELAMLLLCDRRKEMINGRPCLECTSCKKAMAKEHPDLSVIESQKGMIRLDEVKGLVSKLKYPPFEGGLRVVIIVEGDRMNKEAANTLLKTLEEPPPQNVFIITVASRHSLLPTICSRCQILVMAHVEPPLYADGISGEKRFLHLIKGLEATGEEEEKLDKGRALEVRNGLFEILRLYYIDGKKALSVARAFSISKEVSKDPIQFFMLIQLLKGLSRDVLLLRQRGANGLLHGLLINEDQADLLKILASFFNDVELFEHTFRLQELENMVRRGINLEYAINSVILFWFGEHG